MQTKLTEMRLPNLGSLAERIDYVCNLDGNKSKIIQGLDVSSKSLDRYRKGETIPDALQAVKIAEIVNVPIEWLLTGTIMSSDSRDEDYVAIPLAPGAASGGNGLHVEGQVLEHFAFSRALLRRAGINPDKVEFVPVRGDSMEPGIKDGDVVFLDRSKKEISGDSIYVVSLGNEVRIKRVHKGIDGSITLISDNPTYPPEKLSRADAEQLRVHGRVFWTEKLL